MESNRKLWDENLKFITFVINAMKNTSRGLSPFEMTFGRDPDNSSAMSRSRTLTYADLIRK